MIIWINGTFGAGKTTTAYELHKRLNHSFVYDSEHFGYAFMKNIPKDIAAQDFQDYPLWRTINYSLIKQISTQYSGILIIPMTIANKRYFSDIIGTLIQDDIDIHHFTLLASKSTIRKRLHSRFEGKKSWAYAQYNRCHHILQQNEFQTHIYTDGMHIDSVIETIAAKSKLHLLPDKRSRFKKSLDRMKIKLKEVNLIK